MSVVYMPASHVLHSRLPWCRRLAMGTSRVVAMLRREEKVRRREEAEVRCRSSSGSSSRPDIGRFWRAEETTAECVAGVHRAHGLPPPACPPTPPHTLLQASLSPGSEALGKGGSGPVRLL